MNPFKNLALSTFKPSYLLIIGFVIACNILLWAGLNRPHAQEPEWLGLTKGISFTPYRRHHNPIEGKLPTTQEIDEDLKFLADKKIATVRTYSSTAGLEAIPYLAQKYGITVTAGAWLDSNLDKNTIEINNLIDNAQSFNNIDRLIVGNEALLRGDLSLSQLISYLDQVNAATQTPISSAEPWHIWLKYPELAQHVDYIAVHILPYWEGVGAEESIGFALQRYQQIQQAFPDKAVLIAEIGWPSHGNSYKYADASIVNQGLFLRRFLNLAQQQGLDYFVMEAFDQPWKLETEGSVGPYWGMYNTDREAKFTMTGTISEHANWWLQAGIAVLIALIPMLFFILQWRHLQARGHLFYALLIQLVASTMTWILFTSTVPYLTLWHWLTWGLIIPAQLLVMAIVLINGFELAEIKWSRQRQRFFPSLEPTPHYTPKVSIHLAICNEPAHLVIETLNSLAKLDYPHYEVLVIDNNTKDEATWKPVAEHCEKLGSRFRFFSLGKYPGFKAGALNFALKQTAADAEIIGVVDSDYIVRPDWLSRLTPYFQKDQLAFVQAPQDHREWEDDRFKELCNWEYAGFFNIGMVHRNERNAIIQHGTMTLIRKESLEKLNGWSEWCICEDAELGLRLFAAGHESVYVNEIFGKGLTPHSFTGYKNQRFRWAYGAVQILKRHWHNLMPWNRNSTLTLGQRYHFITGWLPWFADGLHLVFTLAALTWTIGLILAPKYFEFPLAGFLVPTIGMFVFKIVHSFWLYQSEVACSLRQRIGAAIAGMSLTHMIAQAMIKGLFTSNSPFLRTPKAENKPALMRGFLMAREESLTLGALWIGALAIMYCYGSYQLESILWMAILLIQSLPYGAALYCSLANALPTRQPKQAVITIPASPVPEAALATLSLQAKVA